MTAMKPDSSDPVEAELVAEATDERQAAEPFGVPRRFGIGTILVITTAFGLLLALLRALGAHPVLVAFVVALVSLIGAGQMLLFGGKRPCAASIVVGMGGLPFLTVVATLIDGSNLRRVDPSVWMRFTLLGAIVGYVIGSGVASVFLFMDAIERFLGRWRGETKDDE